MGGEASAVLYRPSQPYHPVNFEGGLLRDMPTPHRRARSDPHPGHIRSRPGVTVVNGLWPQRVDVTPWAGSTGWDGLEVL